MNRSCEIRAEGGIFASPRNRIYADTRMSTTSTTQRALLVIVTLLALADGILHLSLDFVLFRGNLFGPLGPPPGAPRPEPPAGGGPPPMPLPLNQLFVLNLVGYVVIVLLLWFVAPRLGSRAWLIDLLTLLYVATVFVAWLRFGAPNPMRLGYISKSIEILLGLALLGRIWTRIRVPQPQTASARTSTT
jgi:hypothetical protein